MKQSHTKIAYDFFRNRDDIMCMSTEVSTRYCDILYINNKWEMVECEIKSNWADFRREAKVIETIKEYKIFDETLFDGSTVLSSRYYRLPTNKRVKHVDYIYNEDKPNNNKLIPDKYYFLVTNDIIDSVCDWCSQHKVPYGVMDSNGNIRRNAKRLKGARISNRQLKYFAVNTFWYAARIDRKLFNIYGDSLVELNKLQTRDLEATK